MLSANIYITFNGNCAQAFDFYRSVFGGEFDSISRFSEMPESEDFKPSDQDSGLIMHVSLPLGENTVIMGSDTPGEPGKKFLQGNNFSVSVNTGGKEEADSVFEKLSVNGSVIMAMENTFWGSYFGMLEDQFGINWMVNAPSGQARE